MKKIFLTVAATAAIMVAAAKGDSSDPVLMTVDGRPVYQSEFEYLYNKNNAQQAEGQDLQSYLDLFTVYRLKVADAEAERLDTTENFIKEFGGYRADLSAPYLRDTTVYRRLVDEAYGRMATQRRVSHIMLQSGADPIENLALRVKLDSIRDLIVNHGADFGAMAVKHSTDRSALRNHGDLGFINPNTYPYPFEEAAWATPVGEISAVIDDTPYGYHIIRVEEERPNPGSIKARHILKVTRGIAPADRPAKKNAIDTLYGRLMRGEDFAALAAEKSDDRATAKQGGLLPLIGPGEAAPAFEAAAFALADSAISEPVETEFGYHIIQTLGHYPRKTLDEARPVIMRAVRRDVRASYPEKEFLAKVKKDHNIILSPAALKRVQEAAHATSSSAEAFASLAADATPAATLPDSVITVADIVAAIPADQQAATPSPLITFEENATSVIDDATKEFVLRHLMAENTAYRNLINEYRDGILLFDISNRQVWGRANDNPEELQAYYEANAAKYAASWDQPRFKGFVVFAQNDSLAREARTFLETSHIAPDSVVTALRDKFGRAIKAERVLTAKGDNAIVDEIAWQGPKADPVGKWSVWFPYDWQIINAPEELSDVRPAVVADFQQQLENDWTTELRRKYPVKYNKKTLKQLGLKAK